MTRRSLPQPTNLSQDTSAKKVEKRKPRYARKTRKARKKQKFHYINELPVYAAIYFQLKNSHKENWRRWAFLLDKVIYFFRCGKGICYTQSETWIKILAAGGFKACKKTIENDFKALEKLGLLWRNTWSRPKKAKGGRVRQIVTAWNLDKYENGYIEAINVKGIPKPDKTKKKFYAYKEKVMAANFPRHNAFFRGESKKLSRKKVTVPSVRMKPSVIYNPPIIPPQGGEIVEISENQVKKNTPRVRKIRRPPKPPKIYQKVDDQKLIYALQRPERGTQITTATNPIGEMESALATMCHQPQFAGREETLRTNFRIAWGLHRDRGTPWRKSPLHLAAHATLHEYAIKTQYMEEMTTTEENVKETKTIDYSILQPLLKWGDRTDPAPPPPLPAKAKYAAKALAHALQKDHAATMEDLGYTAEAYGMRCVTTCCDTTVKYEDPYVFAGLMEKCRDRGLVEIALWFKRAFTRVHKVG